MSVPEPEATTALQPGAPGAPQPAFAVVGAAHQPHAAAPTLRLTLEVTEPSPHAIYTIALSTQINLDPARRAYDDATRESLVELFGAPERWPATTRSFVWAQTDVLVPSFQDSTTFELSIPCTYDLEVAATRYLDALPEGEVPLSLHFSGRVMWVDDGRVQYGQVPWSCSAQYRMPVAVWRAMIDHHFPHAGFVRLHADTLQALAREKARRGVPSFDACVAELLDARADA